MPKEQRTIIMKVSATEKTFLEYCREVKFAEGQIVIMDGLPIKLLKPIESIRFDVPIKSVNLTQTTN